MKEILVPDDKLLTRTEVAEIFQVSPSTITRWASAGKLPAVKTLGGHRRYEARAVRELAHRLLKKEINNMERAVIDVPAMYGDHHVVDVRRILLELAGVEEVNASSCFHVVDVEYDPAKITADAIRSRLEEAGYLDELTVPVETGEAVTQEAERDKDIYFRHTAAYEQTRQTVSFAQNISYSGRPLWPCPGMGVVNVVIQTEEETNG